MNVQEDTIDKSEESKSSGYDRLTRMAENDGLKGENEGHRLREAEAH